MRAVLFTAWQDKARSRKRPRARVSTTTSLVLENVDHPHPGVTQHKNIERILTIHFHRFARAKRVFTFNGIWYSEGQTGGRMTRRTYHTHTQDGMLGAAKHANIRNMGEIHRGMRKQGGFEARLLPAKREGALAAWCCMNARRRAVRNHIASVLVGSTCKTVG